MELKIDLYVGCYSCLDIATVNVTTGLSAGNTYWFNVLVKDGVWNKGIYSTNSASIPSTVKTPTFSPAAGQYNSPQNITIRTD